MEAERKSGKGLDWWVRWFGAPGFAVLLGVLDYSGAFARVEDNVVDWRFLAREGGVAGAEELVLVGISEEDLEYFGRWPWSRKVHGDLLALLGAMDEPPTAAAFDLMFTEREGRDGEADGYFGDRAAESGVVVTGGMTQEGAADGGTRFNRVNFGATLPLTRVAGDGGKIIGGEGALLPVEELVEVSFTGFVDVSRGRGVWRKLPLVVRVGEAFYPTLVTQALMLHWGLSSDEVEVVLGREVVFHRGEGALKVPVDEAGQMLLNWRPWEGRFGEASYADFQAALVKAAGGEAWPAGVPRPDGRIVLFGQVAEGLTDFGASPLAAKTPGMLVHATALNDILTEGFLSETRGWWLFVLWGVVAGGALWLVAKRGVLVMALVVASGCAAWTGFAFWLFSAWSVLVPVVWPVVGLLGLFTTFGAVRWQGELAAKRQVREVFAKIVPPQVMEELMANPESIDLIGRRRAVAVLFSDIRSFTTISESMKEEALVEQLNEYFEEMVGRIDQTGGTLSKYIGDAIMAVWGDVTAGTPEELARSATRAALGMKAVLAEVNPRWEAEGKPAFHTGIGINFGEVMVGYIGSARHREFTVIGDAVNTAARLEGLTKEYGAGIAVGESVRELLGEGFVVRTLGLIIVKGKTVPVRVYEVLAEDDAVEAAWAWRYEEAFGRYLGREFAAAAEGFENCLGERPGDLCCKAYAEACRGFEKEAPGEEWDGVAVMTSK